MTPTMLARLQKASDRVLALTALKASPSHIIGILVADHHATFKTGAQTNTLRCAGISASCTWSKDKGLLDAWRGRAVLKLIEPQT